MIDYNSLFSGNNQQQQQQSGLKNYITISYASRFGMILTLVSEDKVGQDGRKYKKFSVMVKIIPHSDQPMMYDVEKSFTLKTSVQNIAALAGALLDFYNRGNITEYAIFTDSSKSITGGQSKKSISVQRIHDENSIALSCHEKREDGSVVGTGVKLNRYDAFGLYKLLDSFVNECLKIIITEGSNNEGEAL